MWYIVGEDGLPSLYDGVDPFFPPCRARTDASGMARHGGTCSNGHRRWQELAHDRRSVYNRASETGGASGESHPPGTGSRARPEPSFGPLVTGIRGGVCLLGRRLLFSGGRQFSISSPNVDAFARSTKFAGKMRGVRVEIPKGALIAAGIDPDGEPPTYKISTSETNPGAVLLYFHR